MLSTEYRAEGISKCLSKKIFFSYFWPHISDRINDIVRNMGSERWTEELMLTLRIPFKALKTARK